MTNEPSRATVRHLDSDRFTIQIRGHQLSVDQPLDDGGTDAAPTPTELFVAGLASCVGFYARRYLARHRLPGTGLTVEVTWSMGVRPARVAEISLQLNVPDALPDIHRQRLLAVATHCTVHNSLVQPPSVSVTLAQPGQEAQSGAA